MSREFGQDNTDKIEHKIAGLKTWPREQLLAEWKRIYGTNAPRHLSKPLMIRFISYRWQEEVYGGLSAAEVKLLDKLAAAYERNPDGFKPEAQIKIGTRLRRLYQGKVHEVTTIADGYVYESTRYGSLSEIARLITGTRWNGKVFFGLKAAGDCSKKRGGVHDQATA